MPRKKKKSIKKSVARRNREIIKFFISSFLTMCVLVLAFTVWRVYSSNYSKVASKDERASLQLETFTPTPKPKKEICTEHDTGVKVSGECMCTAYLIKCEGGKCVDYNPDLSTPLLSQEISLQDKSNGVNGSGSKCQFPDWWCNPPIASEGDGWYCVGKPVIYLYPTKPTLVDVHVKTEGSIVVSDPLYPEGGWHDVLAKPNGELSYKGKQYKELFYESSVKDIQKPNTGLTIQSSDLENNLYLLLDRLGLIGAERDEFVEFWLPKLKALGSKYIFFSILEPNEKTRIDSVYYDPEPDTRIEFIAYFAPLDKPYTGPRLQLPPTPQRVGFTAVEWGGVIGK